MLAELEGLLAALREISEARAAGDYDVRAPSRIAYAALAAWEARKPLREYGAVAEAVRWSTRHYETTRKNNMRETLDRIDVAILGRSPAPAGVGAAPAGTAAREEGP